MPSSLTRIHDEFDVRPIFGNFQSCQNFNSNSRQQWVVNRQPNRNFHQDVLLQLHKPTRCNRQRGKAFAKAGWIYLSCLEQIFSLKSTFRLGRTLFLSSGPKQMSLTTLIILLSTGLFLLFLDFTFDWIWFAVIKLSFIILDRPDQAEKNLVLWPIKVHWKPRWRDLHAQYGRLHSCRGHSLSRFLIFSRSEQFKRW